MAQVLAAVPVHGLDAVLVAVELALESGRPSGEHVLNVLARLKDESAPVPAIAAPLALREEPAANVAPLRRTPGGANGGRSCPLNSSRN
jgi:hypothetical protein